MSDRGTRVTPNPDALAPDDVLRGLKWGMDREDQRRLTHDWMRLHDENERLREGLRAIAEAYDEDDHDESSAWRMCCMARALLHEEGIPVPELESGGADG